MNRLEYLLSIFGEEGSELAQQTSKANRFGIHEQRDLPTSNLERLRAEFNDVLAMAEMLNDEFGLEIVRNESLIARKKSKVNKYSDYSRKLGTLNNQQETG